MNKSHLFFKNPVDGVVIYKPPVRAIFSQEEKDVEVGEKNYSLMKKEFKSYLTNYFSAKNERDSRRNKQLNIPLSIDFIEIEFFNHFKIEPFENRYRNNFGLSPIRYDYFNLKGLFAIENPSKFQKFIDNINLFTLNTDDSELPPELDRNILYIYKFKYYTTSDRKNIDEFKDNYNVELIDSSVDIYESKIKLLENSLIEYLKENIITYKLNDDTKKLEITNVSNEVIDEIIANFDIVMSVSSPISGIIKPSTFNLENKEYGFEISNPDDDLPIVGIIDTGVSALTPLAPLIVNDGEEFDLTNTDSRVDNANHGTAVAAIAALGKSLYMNNSNNVEANAKILSIKVLDTISGYVSESDIRKMIIEAHNKYGVKIFILCLGYNESKADNSSISNYAYSLDIMANELDLLIFISAGNADQYYFDANGDLLDYPNQFNNPLFNITAPADSMNNITCGAISNNLEEYSNTNYNIFDPSYPASYSRKFFINKKRVKSSLISKHFEKPDLCESGGDVDLNIGCDITGLKVLSANPGIFFERICGTSFSTPFIANQALRLLKIYPSLTLQSIKAIILNSCTLPNTGNLFSNLSEVSSSDLFGKGIPVSDYSLYSNENRITIVLEDSIKPGLVKTYPIRLPDYLLDINRKISLLEVNATLCYKFSPILYNHLAYCPIHIAFGIFKNTDLELEGTDENGKIVRRGINGGKVEDYVFKESWSEDYYFKARMLSNCQKIRFVISKKDLINEDCQFKIAIRSKFHGFINALDKEKNDIEHPFSLSITISENQVNKVYSNRLYDEMVAINELEAIAEVEAEIELGTE